MADNKQLVQRGKFGKLPTQLKGGFDYHRELAQTQKITEGDFYSSGFGKRMPNSRLAAVIGIEDGVYTKITECGKDRDKAWATVVGWKGSEENPESLSEETVVHVFDILLLEAIFDAIDNGIRINGELVRPQFEVGEDMRPVILDPDIQLRIMRTHLQKMKFAERDAITKAKRRVYLALSGKGRQQEDEEPERVGKREPDSRDDFLAVLIEKLKECHALSPGETPVSLLASLTKEAGLEPVKRVSDLKSLVDIKEMLSRTNQRIIKLKKELEDMSNGETIDGADDSTDNGDATVREGL